MCTRLALVALLAAAICLGWWSTALPQQVILDRDIRPLFPGFPAAVPREGLPVGAMTFRIRDVRNISGNNPFHQRQPLLNFNGRVVSTVAELVALIRGGAAPPGPTPPPPASFSCNPAFAEATLSDFSLAMHLNEAGTQCSVARVQPAGQFPTYFISNPYAGSGPPPGRIFVGRVPGGPSSPTGVEIVQFPGGFIPVTHSFWGAGFSAPPGTYEITIQRFSDSKRFRVNFTMEGVGTDGFFHFRTVRHRVNSVTPL